MADMNEKLAAAGKTFADVASTKKPAPAVQEGTLVRETGTPDMPVEEIETRELLDAVTRIRHEEWRLIQICASKVAEDSYEILYTFGRACMEMTVFPVLPAFTKWRTCMKMRFMTCTELKSI